MSMHARTDSTSGCSGLIITKKKIEKQKVCFKGGIHRWTIDKNKKQEGAKKNSRSKRIKSTHHGESNAPTAVEGIHRSPIDKKNRSEKKQEAAPPAVVRITPSQSRAVLRPWKVHFLKETDISSSSSGVHTICPLFLYLLGVSQVVRRTADGVISGALEVRDKKCVGRLRLPPESDQTIIHSHFFYGAVRN